MKKNVGSMDSIIRYIVAVILVVVGYYLEGVASYIAWFFALAALLTGLFHFCGLYALLGINTCSLKDK